MGFLAQAEVAPAVDVIVQAGTDVLYPAIPTLLGVVAVVYLTLAVCRIALRLVRKIRGVA